MVDLAADRSFDDILTEQQRLHSGAAEVAFCPVCGKAFRQNSYSVSLSDSIRAHIRSKSRTCDAHARFRAVALSPVGPNYQCPAQQCTASYRSIAHAWAHFIFANDDVHRSCKVRHLDPSERARQRTVAREAEAARRERERMLYASAKSNMLDLVEQLVAEGVDPNAGGEDGFTPLMTSAEAGHTSIVTYLLRKGKDRGCLPNAQNKYGQTALSLAAQNNQLDCVSALLADDDVNLTLRGNAGLNAAQMARQAGHEIVAGLISERDSARQIDLLMKAVEQVRERRDFDSMEQRLSEILKLTGTDQMVAASGQDQDEDEYNLEDEEAHMCVVCLCKPVEVALAPCWHAQCCAECATVLEDCPICRGPIVNVQRIYLP